MKKLFILILLFSLPLFAKPANKLYKVVVLEDWKPYYFLDENKKPKGYAVELFEKLASNIGLNYEYVIVDSWKEADRLMKEKKVDIIPNMGVALKRTEYITFTQPTDVFEVELFKHKSLTEIRTVKDIKKHSVGVVLKNVCISLITEDIAQTKILFQNYHRALAALNDNEVDILCYPKPLVNLSIKELNLENIEPLGEPLKVIKRALGVVKGEEHLLDLMDKEILRLKGNGEYQRIYNKWFGIHKDIEMDFEQLSLIILALGVIVLLIAYYIRQKKWILTKKELEQKVKEQTLKIEKNLSELKNTTLLYEKEKNKFKNMFKTHGSIMLLIEPVSGRIIDVNESALKFYGYSNDEFLQMKISQINMLDAEEIFKKTSRAKENIQNRFEFPHRLKNGLIKTVEVYTSPVETEDGMVLFSIIKDITEQKRLQNRIIEQKEEFETIFNYAKDGIAVVDLQTNFLNCNRAFIELTGYSKEELLGKSCNDLTIISDREENQNAIRKAIEKGHVDNLEKSCIVNGRHITVNMSISLLPDKKTLLFIIKDITSLKIIQEQAKLISMGEMIGNIAHQWRQPLNVISMSASSLILKTLKKNISEEDIQKFSNTIVKQTNYLSNTIDNFRNFIKGDRRYLNISIKEVIRETLSLVGATLESNYIVLITDLDDDMFITGNKSELSQALINIINNAKDSMIDNEEGNEKLLFISTKKLDDNTIELKIVDSGGGIESGIIDRIFEPYFTTKHQSVGTGIGLSMVEQIIRERHKGTITVHNEEYRYNNKHYKGACFNIVFKITGQE